MNSLSIRTTSSPSAASNMDQMSLVNIAARQRMLSHRLILQVVLAHQGKPEQLQAAEQTLATFRDSEALLVRTARAMSDKEHGELHEVYFGSGRVEATVDGFIRLAQDALEHIRTPRATTAPAQERLIAGLDQLLKALNAATTAFDRISVDKEARIMRELKHIVGNIQSVAREAKIVSFNAQVIAARAGTVGREFAVVANTLASISAEVDSLAKQGVTLASR